jgi:hypothetical protein
MVMKIGSAMTDAWSAALRPERNHARPWSCWRTASAERVSEEDDERDRHEERGAELEASFLSEVQPQPECEERKRD